MADLPTTVYELTPCPNTWHHYHWGSPQPGIRTFLTCPECPEARHYELARLARVGMTTSAIEGTQHG